MTLSTSAFASNSIVIPKNLYKVLEEDRVMTSACGMCLHIVRWIIRLTFSHRMPFTGADDEHLAAYLAKVTPCEECGGRDGNKIYEELVEQVSGSPSCSQN